MATFDRAELLSILTDAKPALSSAAIIPELGNFWFDKKYVYAYDGGLGIRLPLETEFACGVPGKMMLDLLKTSALKEVFLDIVKNSLVIQMGKSKPVLSTSPLEDRTWHFPISPPKNSSSIVLSEAFIEALRQVKFVRIAKPSSTIHHGIIILTTENDIEVYATDTASVVQVIVDERPGKLSPFMLPWAFVDCILDLVEPGSTLHILSDCLMVETPTVMVCSNLLEFPKTPDLQKTVANLLTDQEPIVIPTGLQLTLDRASILAGKEEAFINVDLKGSMLTLRGKYAAGSLDEPITLTGKGQGSGKFKAEQISRALTHASGFNLSRKCLTIYGGDNFLYLLGQHA